MYFVVVTLLFQFLVEHNPAILHHLNDFLANVCKQVNDFVIIDHTHIVPSELLE